MTNQHPITPPPELVEEWIEKTVKDNYIGIDDVEGLVNEAAQWGSNQELEACCEWLAKYRKPILGDDLRYVRRPKPSSLKERALAVLDDVKAIDATHYNILRNALEALPND